jgi:haloalkane dehalogenase
MKSIESRREFIKRLTTVVSWIFFGTSALGFSYPTLQTKVKERSLKVFGKKMTYLEAGEGSPIIFFHGNPTRAYLWRNILPIVANKGLCIAPDLIGMGNSDKLDAQMDGRYTYKCHRQFIDEFLEQILQENDKVILVGHDWGGVLSHDWARRNEARVRGIAFMETFLEPCITGSTPEPVIKWFRNFRTKEFEDKVLKENHFLESVFFKGLPNLTEESRSIYRAPFPDIESRLPTLIWPREVPIDEDPLYTHQVFSENKNFMATTKIPKLFINAEPGALLGNEFRRSEIRKWSNVTEVKVEGNHFIQEQCPKDIGGALSSWISLL